jgi:hypothetical protein
LAIKFKSQGKKIGVTHTQTKYYCKSVKQSSWLKGKSERNEKKMKNEK